MRMKALLPLMMPLVGVLSFGSAASAQQSGTTADAQALLTKGVAAVKAGKAFGQEMLDKAKDGEVVTVDYMFPRPNTTTPVAKESFVEGIGDIACGVGYYK